MAGLLVDLDDRRMDLARVGQRQLPALGLVVGDRERRAVDVAAVERHRVGKLAGKLGDVREDRRRDADEGDRHVRVRPPDHEPAGELDVGLLGAEHARPTLMISPRSFSAAPITAPSPVTAKLARVGAGEADVGVGDLLYPATT